MVEHWTKVGVNLSRAVNAYNSTTASLETRVLASARKFEDLKIAPIGAEIKAVLQVERTVRMFAEINPGDEDVLEHIDGFDVALPIVENADSGAVTPSSENVAPEIGAVPVAAEPGPSELPSDTVSVPWWQHTSI